MITIEDLYKAYFDCRKNKRSSLNALDFELDYERKLHILLDEINSRTYEIGRSICFIVDHPKLREVFAADFRDRIVHHLVVRKIEPLLEDAFICDTFNCRKGKGTLYGVKRLEQKVRDITENYTKDAYIGKFDCKNFFMSIHKPTLWNMLKEFIENNYHETDKEDILWLAEKIVLHCPHKNCIRRSPIEKWDRLENGKSLFTCGDDYGLPIGNLSSQIFANFYLLGFDLMMRDMFGDGYGRYVDDFFVISRDKQMIPKAIPIIKDSLAKLQITLHPKKIYIQHYSKGVKFTGAVVKPGRTYIAKSTIHTLKKKINRFAKTKDKDKAVNQFVQSVNSYMGFLRQHNTYNMRVRMLGGIWKDWRPYVKIGGKYEKLIVKSKYKKHD